MLKISESISPNQRKGFTEIFRKITELMVFASSENISLEKTKSNMAVILLLLENIMSLGLGENSPRVEKAMTKHMEHLKHPSGSDAIKQTSKQILKIAE